MKQRKKRRKGYFKVHMSSAVAYVQCSQVQVDMLHSKHRYDRCLRQREYLANHLLGNYAWKAQRDCISAEKKGTGIDFLAARKMFTIWSLHRHNGP